jgi:hypothetical protein
LNGQTSLLHAPIRAIQKAPADSHAHGARSRAKPRCLHRRALENAASNRTPLDVPAAEFKCGPPA